MLHLHLADSEGWRIESKRFPKLTATTFTGQQGSGFYSQDDIKRLNDYALGRGLEIVPEIDLPGHSNALLAAYPELGCTGRKGDIVCPGKESTFEFLGQLLEELCGLFPGKYFHIGGDEAPKSGWKACPDCAKKLEEIGGGDDYEKLQGYFENRLNSIVKAQGKRTICWNDALASGNLDADIIIQYWTPQYADLMKPFAEKGGSFIMSDMFHLYFDYPYSMSPLKKVFDYQPVVKGVDLSTYPGFLGEEACRWTAPDVTLPVLLDSLFPRLDALFSDAPDYDAFRKNVEKRCADAAKAGIVFHPLDRCDPEGEARQKETFAFMQHMTQSGAAEQGQNMENSPAKNKDFIQSFITCFFRPEDMPILQQYMKSIGFGGILS
jgi:hexosaminidase